uniref:C-type lectin domain-containing protein n=1 Tax=Mastacembelus armatus TaxID=205130 RepID=A0A7N8X5M9_9TELE
MQWLALLPRRASGFKAFPKAWQSVQGGRVLSPDVSWDQLQLLFSVPSSYLLRHYHYVNLKMTWANAQQYCRAKYTDLAIFKNMNQVNRLNRPNLDTALAWIGLRDDPTFWMGVMTTGNTSATGYQNWLSGEPNNKYIEYCGLMNSDGSWNDIACKSLYGFVCYTGKKNCNIGFYLLL